MNRKYLYGPVSSRRLGRSLGVNIMPHKTCSLDCIYCECGKTTNLTLERKEYTPTAEIINELAAYLKEKPQLDYITFSGSGEPTMHSGIGEIISFLKENFPQYKVAVLTNSTLLNDPQVREDIKNADLIVPSLDGVSKEVFHKIDRPHENVSIEEIVSGIRKLKEISSGDIWLEIFIVPGVNDTPEELKLFKEILEKINVTKVQLNSLDRPGIVDWLKPADKEHLKKIAAYLGNVEIVN
ncbi:MAG: Radical domain protein [Clostridiales bacterium]|jgi:wyosine [tRNA(Phe)-imidazoG37] synthetase (radical SAM superfamily)|nr:Radical domain protein [Clostridiales bacterium]